LQQQARLQEFGILAHELIPTIAIAAFGDMLLNQRQIRDRHRFMVSIFFAEVPGVVADCAAHARQCRGELAGLKIQVRRAYMREVPKLAFRQRALLQRPEELAIGHYFSLRR
jgi:hypothetical protein